MKGPNNEVINFSDDLKEQLGNDTYKQVLEKENGIDSIIDQPVNKEDVNTISAQGEQKRSELDTPLKSEPNRYIFYNQRCSLKTPCLEGDKGQRVRRRLGIEEDGVRRQLAPAFITAQ